MLTAASRSVGATSDCLCNRMKMIPQEMISVDVISVIITKMPNFHRVMSQKSEAKQKLGGLCKRATTYVMRSPVPMTARQAQMTQAARGMKGRFLKARITISNARTSWIKGVMKAAESVRKGK